MSAEGPTPQAAQRRRHERTVFHEITCNGAILGAKFTSVEAGAAAAQKTPVLRQLPEKSAHQMTAALVSAVNLTEVPEVIIGRAHFAAVEDVFTPILRCYGAPAIAAPCVAPWLSGRQSQASGPRPTAPPHLSSTRASGERFGHRVRIVDPLSVHQKGTRYEGSPLSTSSHPRKQPNEPVGIGAKGPQQPSAVRQG